MLVSQSPKAGRPSLSSQAQPLVQQLGVDMGSLTVQAPMLGTPRQAPMLGAPGAAAAVGDWLQQQQQQLGLTALGQAIQQQQIVSGSLADADLGLAGFQARSLDMYQAAAAAAGSHQPVVLLQSSQQSGTVQSDLAAASAAGLWPPQVGLPAGAIDVTQQALQGQGLQLAASLETASGELPRAPSAAAYAMAAQLQQQQQQQQDQQQQQWVLRLF